MRFGNWNVMCLYGAGSLAAAAAAAAATSELGRCKLHLVGVQEGRWDREGTVRAGGYIVCP